MQQFDGGGQLFVFLLVRRNIGLRTGLLVFAVLQMALERGFALGVVLAFQFIRHILQNDHVGVDALGLNRATRWRVVTRRRQTQGAAIAAERDDRLHRAFAEGARTDNRRALVILQRAGDDFRRRGGAAIDQHDNRLPLREIARPSIVALRFFGVAAACGDNLALVDEGVHDLNRLIKQSARIVAQIDDVAFELVGGDFLLRLRHRVAQSVGGLFVELRDADVIGVVALLVRAHGFDVNFGARHFHVDLLLIFAAENRQLHRRVDLAAHFVDGLIESHALHALVVDGANQIARKNAGARRWRIVDRRDDFHQTVFLRDFNAETAEFAFGLGAHVLESLGVKVARMRVERGQHAGDGVFDQLLFVRLLDIISANLVEHVAEQAQVLIGVGGGGQRLR